MNLRQKRLEADLIAAISARPLAVNLVNLGNPSVNTVVGGIAGAGFLLGFIMGLSIFQKNTDKK